MNVQTMVFGNTGDDSATGVAFTRNPATGEDMILKPRRVVTFKSSGKLRGKING